MDRIEALCNRLDSLSADELDELRGLILVKADELLAAPESVATGAAVTKLSGFATKLSTFTAAKQLGEFRAETVTASAGAPSGVAAVRSARRPLQRNPEAARGTAGGTRVLLASSPGQYGEEVQDRWALGAALAAHLEQMDRHGPARGRVLVASSFTTYSEDRQLDMDAVSNMRKLEESVGQSALLASGGVCAPTNVSYEVLTWATAARPLKEGLPAFEAPRGGLLFIEAPSLAPLGAATGIWTEAVDAQPEAQTKPSYSVSCGATLQVYLNAVPTRLGFGNLQARFQPELLAANVDLAAAMAARKAEIKLLETIQEKALKDVTSTKNLGAARDLVTVIRQAVSNYRFTYRIDRKIGLTAIFPEWVKDIVAIDLAKELAHAQGSDWNSLMISDEQVEDVITTAGVRPIFTLDGLPEVTGGTGHPAQTFTVQTENAGIVTFPSKLQWFMFVEGSVQYLDGGRLDLGVVRDSTLDATNDFEVFTEVFENIADRGFAKSILALTTELCASGASQATVDTHTVCA
jgi:hypothetical protein